MAVKVYYLTSVNLAYKTRVTTCSILLHVEDMEEQPIVLKHLINRLKSHIECKLPIIYQCSLAPRALYC